MPQPLTLEGYLTAVGRVNLAQARLTASSIAILGASAHEKMQAIQDHAQAKQALDAVERAILGVHTSTST